VPAKMCVCRLEKQSFVPPCGSGRTLLIFTIPLLLNQTVCTAACVNCVRWSSEGRYLASASDDKLIMIWQFSRYCACIFVCLLMCC